jgi:L-alanine-DL-glutamate epimerase-like enolase superfamily enzyme
MANIRDIRLIPLSYELPQIRAYGMAGRLIAGRGAALVEVEAENGAVGIGEGWVPAKAVAGHLELIRNEFVGFELYDHAHVWSRTTSGMYHLGLQNK